MCRAFGYVGEVKNTIFKNLITYGIYCVRLVVHISTCFYFYE